MVESKNEQMSVEVLRKGIRVMEEKSRALIEESEQAFLAGDLEGAKSAYLRALEIDPSLMFEGLIPPTPARPGSGTVEEARQAMREMAEEWEAEQDIIAGRTKRFSSSAELLDYLHSDEE